MKTFKVNGDGIIARLFKIVSGLSCVILSGAMPGQPITIICEDNEAKTVREMVECAGLEIVEDA